MSAHQDYAAASTMSVDDMDWNRTFKRPAPGAIPPADRDPPAPEWSPITAPASSPRPAQRVLTAEDIDWNRTFKRPSPGSVPPIDRDPTAPAWSPLTTPTSSPRLASTSLPIAPSGSIVDRTVSMTDLRSSQLDNETDKDTLGPRYPGPYQDMLGPPYPSPYHDIDDPTLPFGPNHITSARDLYGLAISAKTRKITADRQQFLAIHYGLGYARDPDSRGPLDAFLNEVAAISSYEGSDTFSHIQDLDVRDTIMAFSKVPWAERMAFVNAMRGPARAEETDAPVQRALPEDKSNGIITAYRDPALSAPEYSGRHRADHEEQYLARVRALVDPARKRSPDEEQRRTAIINAWAQREAMKMNEEGVEMQPRPAKKAKRRRKDW